MTKLTEVQSKILEGIKEYSKENGYPPTVREIGRMAELKSTSSTHRQLEILEAKQLIKVSRKTPRGIKIL